MSKKRYQRFLIYVIVAALIISNVKPVQVKSEGKASSVYGVFSSVDYRYDTEQADYEYVIPDGNAVSLREMLPELGVFGQSAVPETNEENQGNALSSSEAEQGADEKGGFRTGSEDSTAGSPGGPLITSSTDDSDQAVIDEEVIEAFLGEITEVSFSDDSLAAVVKVEENTTVGQVVEEQNLKVEYSEELPEGAVEAINSKELAGDDWALINLQPFTTEEYLTVKMANGEAFSVKMIDGQLHTFVIGDQGETYEITVTYNEASGIPADAELRVEEITEDDPLFAEYLAKALRALDVEKEVSETPEEREIVTAGIADVIQQEENNRAGNSASNEDGPGMNDTGEVSEAEAGEEAAQTITTEDHQTFGEEKTFSEYARFFNIEIYSGEERIEPASDVRVSIRLVDVPQKDDMTLNVLHFEEAETKASYTEEIEKALPAEETVKVVEASQVGEDINFLTNGFSVYGILGTETITVPFVASDGSTYEVTVNYRKDAGIPEDSTLEVFEIEKDTAEYSDYVEKTAEAIRMDVEDLKYIRLLDIKILDASGNKVSLEAPVDVKIRLLDRNDMEEAQVVHFADGAEEGDVVGGVEVEGKTVSFEAEGFSVYAVIGGTEPTARMKVNFHVISYDSDNQPVDTIIATAYVKNEDDEDALQMILYDPGVGELDAGKRETFRGWTLNENYTVDEATTEFNNDFENPYGAMTIEDVRDWAKDKQGPDHNGIVENPMPVYDFYAMILKNYQVIYLDRFGISLDTDSAYMLRNETVSNYTINQNYETNDDDYHFKGWITETEEKITSPNPAPETVTISVEIPDTDPVQYQDKNYKLYTNNTKIVLDGDISLKAHAPKGKWLIFHEVMKGATYVAPQFLEEGESPNMPAQSSMLLLGYEFAGWYKTCTETTDPDTGVTTYSYSDPFTPGPITEKTNIYAKWEPATWAPYTVIIWKQNLDGEYSYAESIQLAGTVGTIVPTTGDTSVNNNQTGNYVLSSVNNNDADYLVVNGRDMDNNSVQRNYQARHTGRTGEVHNYENLDYVGFNCARIDQNVTIKPEGNAVVNVYYDRITYTIKIYHARRSGNNYNVFTTRSNNNTLSPEGMNQTGTINYHQNDNNAWETGYQGPPEGVLSETHSDGNTYYYTTITAKYGEDISGQWPKYEDYPNLDDNNTHTGTGNNSGYYTFVSWYMMNDAAGYRGNGSGLDTFKGVISKMDEKLLGDITRSGPDYNYLVGRYDGRIINIYTYQIWKEALLDDDGEPIIPTGKEYKVGTDGKTYILEDSIQANSNAAPSGTQAPEYIGYEHIASMDVKPALVNNRATIQFYYHRVVNPIVYRDGSYFDGNGNRLTAYPALGADQESDPIAYETNITSYNGGYNDAGELSAGENYKTDYPSSYPGFVFEGWYTDAACTTPYTFSTMPDTSITVYAKFRQVQYRVFLHPKVPEGKYVTWGSDNQAMNFRGTYGRNISLPTGKLIVNEENPDQIDDSYEFAGWYLDPQYRQPFDPEAYVMNDDIASPYDKNVDMTDKMDKYGNILNSSPKPEGTAGPGFNSDLYDYNEQTKVFTLRNRWWVNSKVDLYGKWVKKMEAGTGIQIIYDSNGGSFSTEETIPTFTDTTLYKDGTHAVAQSAPVVTPTVTIEGETKNKVFLYWVLQKWNPEANNGEGAYEDVHPLDFVYPGDSFDVSFANARTVETIDPDTHEVTNTEYFIQLRAEYIDPDKDTPTHIWWYSNFGDNEVVKLNDTDEVQNVEDIKINEGVFIKPEDTFTRPGYKFLGWARVDSTYASGTAVPGHPELHQELDEDDLFLKYVQASGNVAAHFEAKDSHDKWVPVTQVAADEKHPYHDLYAVWKPEYYTVTIKKVVNGFPADAAETRTYSVAYSYDEETGKKDLINYNNDENNIKTISDQIVYDTIVKVEETNEPAFQVEYFAIRTTDDMGVELDTPATVTEEEDGGFKIIGDTEITVKNTRIKVPVTVIKTDQSGNALEEADFEFTGPDFDGQEGITYTSKIAEGGTDAVIVASDSVGAGTYVISETEAPAGYNQMDAPVTIGVAVSETGPFDMLVTATFEGEIGTASAQPVDVNSPERGWIVTISNNAGVELPMTGGPGTSLYTLGGIALIMASALMYGFRMRRRERRLN